ncbi:hypothetical protein IFR04_005913 [Cadophora malorum]|uniref:Uncharacterized protein n=1 Tax=Cadophora malorum TaxID=108018 RepID=A0A8H7TL82_9HELO|nr:hypothetical protein IFR04_005913 [Cadophora malorum]
MPLQVTGYATGTYFSHTWEILYLVFSPQALNDPSDLNILQRKLVEESEYMQEYFPGYRAFHLDFNLWKSFRSDPFPWLKIVVNLIQPLISDSAEDAESQNQGPSEVREEGEVLNASPLSPLQQLSTTLDCSQLCEPDEQLDLNVRSVPPPRMFELEASQPYQRFRTLSSLDGPDDDQAIPDDISEISHVTWWDSRMPGESVEPPLVERENLTMVDDDGFSVASQHTHLISRYPTTSTAESDTPLNHTQPSSQQSPVVGTQQPQYQQPSGRFVLVFSLPRSQ